MITFRLYYMLDSEIIPFNYDMDYETCLAFYDKHHATLPELCPDDPRGWSKETVDMVNKRAAEQSQLVERLMKLPEDEFYKEVDRLAELNKAEARP